MDVFTVERGDEGAVQPLDDFMREKIALVFDLLDLVGLVPDRPLGREHRVEQPGAVANLLRERREVVVELFFPRYQSERHSIASGF